MPSSPSTTPRLLLPEAPALVAGIGRATLITPDGEIETLANGALARHLAELPPPLLVHAPVTARRLNLAPFPVAYDLLELFAFVLPAQLAAPTPRGLAQALEMEAPKDDEAAAILLPEIATTLLRRLASTRHTQLNRDAAQLAARLRDASDWVWAPSILAALGQPDPRPSTDALKVWRRLPEWEETAPPTPPASLPIAPLEARKRLAEILGGNAETRPAQADYASAAALAFAPREVEGQPQLVLAEAGTGTGKTLGYIAPASLWAERNGAPVWISTYTRNLQRQIDQELFRLYPDPEDRRRHVVIRKGRENYLCLLNHEEAVNGAMPSRLLALSLVSRWAAATRDGDMQGGDFPGWIAELFPWGHVAGLTDRRGECIHSACPHWRRCFVEHSIRRARTARLVIANHALVMIQAALGGGEDRPALRYVFDEGHHLFDAADGAFSAEVSGGEMAELRRWLLGAEGSRGRARGLRRRLEEITSDHPALLPLVEEALRHAGSLPGPGWSSRLGEPEAHDIYEEEEAEPLPGHPADTNPGETFLRAVILQVFARSPEADTGYDAECDLHPLNPGVAEAGSRLEEALTLVETPLRALHARITGLLEDPDLELETGDRIRLDTARRTVDRRGLRPLGAWRAMLKALSDRPPEPGTRPAHVDWLAITRRDGRVIDAAMHRHFLDPTEPFASTVAAPAHGLLITSATLRDSGEHDPEAAWEEAETRTGAVHLPTPAIRAAVPSPFDYPNQTLAIVVTDVAREGPQAAMAMEQLFRASGGGALGLFTAIRRLRDAHARMAPGLEAAGLPLYAQHVDAMDNSTLVDVFRAEEDSCLLGTDALRDGVDVPGRSLRLLVFDRIPWPRPTILHRERRTHLSGARPKAYDDAIARHRLRQAFGRLIRRADDRGVFVLLDARAPSRLLAGLPDGVIPQRMGLADAVRETRRFLNGDRLGD
ncbi:ATP-dependent DNA helicase [Roseomonas xinghualingensis]|uniref:ATP-dependent DNA helicase n=1 Tax=Roseomonas xinghualingensis TaxID=2986475 RepID=UPI0021F20822|nr:ATP-dependent DNA helicase [Roseomonas sp. SXEYE001]MCV4206587.1 ATP-dependent DNA helicase [Roseomonas sp. SXEYE001]